MGSGLSNVNPVVSICIANYNGIDFIDACIESVQAQDCRFAYEIIVHDDASGDGSAAHIRIHHPDVRLIESSDNVGFCIANNRMAEVARGRFLLLLNNDATLLPDALHTLHVEASDLAREAVLSPPQFDYDSGELIDRGCLLDPFLNPVPNLDETRHDVAMTIGACLWIPRSLWEDLGGFPGWFESIGEDLYLCCRARLLGHPVRVLRASGYRHRVGASFGGGKIRAGRLATTRKRRALSERNKLFTAIVCQPIAPLLALLPLHLILIHLEGVVLSLVKRDAGLWLQIYAPLLPSIWRTRGHLWHARVATQRSRRVRITDWLSAFHWRPWKLQMLLRYGLPEIR